MAMAMELAEPAPYHQYNQKASHPTLPLTRDFFQTNSSAEGHFNGGKNHTSRFREKFSSGEQLISSRWKETVENEKMLALEVAQMDNVLEMRRERAIRDNGSKTNSNSKASNTEKTKKKKLKVKRSKSAKPRQDPIEDGYGEFKEDRGNMVWARKQEAKVKRVLKYRKRLKKALKKATKHVPKGEHSRRKKDSKFCQHEMVMKYAEKHGMEFMGYGTYLPFMDRKRKAELKPAWKDVIDAYYKEFVGPLEGEKSKNCYLQDSGLVLLRQNVPTSTKDITYLKVLPKT